MQIEFAKRAAKRLETVARRLEASGRLEADGETLARAQELRVAAFMVRDYAKVMTRKTHTDRDQKANCCEQPRIQVRSNPDSARKVQGAVPGK